MERLAPNYFVAGIPTDEFRYFAAPESTGRQRQVNWCWAAVVQMVLNAQGLPPGVNLLDQRADPRVFTTNCNYTHEAPLLPEPQSFRTRNHPSASFPR